MYIKFLPNEYVLHYRKGKLIESGTGLSFYFFHKSTAAAVIPVSAMDADFIYQVKTADFQSVTVQGQLAYRIVDCDRIANLMNFTINLRTKGYYDDPLKKLTKRIINIADVMVKRRIEMIDLKTAVQSNHKLAGEILEEFGEVNELNALGVQVTGFSILNISAGNETHRALEAKTREAILKESDDALYERRNASIDQERKVKENELNTEISVEEKKKQIKETEIATKRMLMEKENELKKIEVNAEAERKRIIIDAEIATEQVRIDAEIELERKRKELAELRLENAKKDADAEAYRLSGIMEAYNKLSAEVLIALATLNMEPEKMIAGAFEKLAASGANIGTLNITPDLLESLTKR